MGSSSFSAEYSSSEVFSWLKSMPVAPEYHPTVQEFQDPISYIFKIENEASKYGICKIVPPVPPPSKKSVISNFNKSISLLNSSRNGSDCNSESNSKNVAPTFITRQQQIGFCPRKQRPIQKSVWQSGESYTLSQFEAKAKNFEKSFVKNHVKGSKKTVSPLEVETLYWRANGDRPFSVEYANDMPGSGFALMKEIKAGEVVNNVGESAWNMRGVARANGSLLKYMKEEIPGVTSPMVYVAMMFSWFAWHVEDHDLHSLNYLHLGSGKTWYGVPRDAALAFEEVIRVHGFGEEINPRVTFATLGQKTTVMSPEVLMNAGVPCCRLVQNAGEFVVTFPRAYHSGFSHGFNCGEASNIATPEWLRFAKDAAIRRASINYPPMVSHFQLLYDLALAIRVPAGNNAEPRSSRLKDKKKSEGEMLVKQMFVQDVIQHNDLLYTLGQGSEVVLLPHNSSEKFVWSNLHVGSKYNNKVKPGLPFSVPNSEESVKAYDDIMLARDIKQHKAFYSVKAKLNSISHEKQHSQVREDADVDADGLSDRGLFSCVKCGIWTFACVAIVQPTETAAQYLMSSDCSLLKDGVAGLEVLNHGIEVVSGDANHSEPNSLSGSMKKIKSDNGKSFDEGIHIDSNEHSSALGLLAMTYGNSSDSDEEEDAQPSHPVISEDNSSGGGHSWDHQDKATSPNSDQGCDSEMERDPTIVSPRSEYDDEGSPQRSDFYEHRRTNSGDSEEEQIADRANSVKFSREPDLPFTRECDEDSSRMHVFCLEHALEVEKQLQPIGGVHVVLLCHPDYPNVQFEAMKVAEELDIKYEWKEIAFTEATKIDEERIQLALQSEEETPKTGDWSVKLGINLFYSAILSRSPLYNKQMPYNSVIYDAFGCKSSPKPKISLKSYGRQRKIIVAGKWCGKFWMSNQVHPLLLQTDSQYEDERGENLNLRKTPETSYKTHNAGKRKLTSVSSRRVVKKMKFDAVELADTDADDSVDDDDDDKPEIVSRRSVRKPKTPSRSVSRVKSHFEDESPDGLSKRKIRSVRRVQNHAEESPDNVSEEDSVDVRFLQHGLRRCERKTKPARKPTRPVKVKVKVKVKVNVKDIGDSNSEASLSNEYHEERISSPDSETGPSQKDFQPVTEDEVAGGPSTRLRKRISKPSARILETRAAVNALVKNSRTKKSPAPILERTGPKMRFPGRRGPKMRLPVIKTPVIASDSENEEENEDGDEFRCDMEGCTMSFESNEELVLHKRNICPVKGCGKTFFSHKYLVQHRRVHVDDRPLKCPWKGCKMAFKWAWARTEHIRVHTGARPYVCTEPDCGQTFRFVSDFSRHKRKTGHSIKKAKK